MGGISNRYRSGWNIIRDDRSGADDRATAKRHALEDDRARANPDVVSDGDWSDVPSAPGQRMLIRIHDEHVSCDFAIPPNHD
jgi:hypothetical protein